MKAHAYPPVVAGLDQPQQHFKLIQQQQEYGHRY